MKAASHWKLLSRAYATETKVRDSGVKRCEAQLLFQDLDLFLKIFNGELLVTVEPAGQANQNEL
jgi:hypothetical protein